MTPGAFPDIMVDLETLGPCPGSVIVAIGAVAFDPRSQAIGSRISINIDPASGQALGLTIDGETVLWWLGREEAARRALTEGAKMEQVPALGTFSWWWRQNQGVRFWGHGGNFDDPVLAAAYRAAGLKTPWRYSNSRCTRTLYDLAGVEPDREAGVHHTALDDAIAQARAVQAGFAKLGLATVPDFDADTRPIGHIV